MSRYCGTDCGPPCACGSTVYGYTVEYDDDGRDHFVAVRCYGCGRASQPRRCPDLDTLTERPADITASMLRELHEAGRL